MSVPPTLISSMYLSSHKSSSSIPLFPDAGRDNLMSYLNSQSQDSTISSKENSNRGSFTTQRSNFSAPDIRNVKSISSSVHHHSYDPRMRSNQKVKTQTHGIRENRSDGIKNPNSSSVQHHRYEPSVSARENQRVRDKENAWDAHYRSEMPGIPERVHSSKNDSSRKHQHSSQNRLAHQTPILTSDDFIDTYKDITSVPSNETFDSTLSTEKFDDDRYNALHVYEKHSERSGNRRSNIHYSNVAAEIAESRPPNNITLADELLQKRYPRSRQIPPQHPLNHDLAAFQKQTMNASRAASHEINCLSSGRETDPMDTAPFQAHRSFDMRPTCFETTFDSTKRGTPGGRSRSLSTDRKESEYRPVDHSSSFEGIRPYKNSQMNNKYQQQDTQVFDNKRDEDDYAIRKRKRLSILQEIREVMDMRRYAVSMEDDDEVRLLSRHLDLLHEELDGTSIGSAIQTKLKEGNHRVGSTIQTEGQENNHSVRSAPIQTEGKVGNHSIRSSRSMSSAPIQTEGKELNYNIRSVPIQNTEEVEDWSYDVAENIYLPKGNVHDIEKVPDLKDASAKTNTIKIRAPSDLKAGYEFTATIQGNVVQAIVVSILNIGFYKVINVVLCRS